MKSSGNITLLAFILLYSCSNVTGDCSNEIYQRIDNPDKTHKIVKFERGCGATVGNSIQLSVIKTSDSLKNEGGNIFISTAQASWDESDTTIIASWINNNTILIKYDDTLNIFKKDSLIAAFKVIYQPK